MDRETVENIIKSYGFVGESLDDDNDVENTIIYERHSYDSLDIIKNGVDLYVTDCNHVRFEVSDYGLCIRLYYDYHYIGALVDCWEDIESFELGGGV